MKIKYLKLQNFMPVSLFEASFDKDNMVIINGPNGAGKSSIFEAIALCLFERRKGDKYSDYIQTGATEANINLIIEHAGFDMKFDVIVDSSKTRTTLTRSITYNGTTYNNSECTTFLKSQFDLTILEHIMFSMQKEESFIKLYPAERRTLFKKLFDFNFETQIDFVRDKIAELQKQLIVNETLYTEAVKKEFHTYDLLDYPETDIEQNEIKILALEKQIRNYDVTILEYENYASKQETIKLEKASAESIIQRKKDALTNIESFTESKLKHAEAIEIYKGRLTEISALILEKNKELQAIRDELKNHKTKSNEVYSVLVACEYEVNAANTKYESAKDGVCDSCGQVIPDDFINSCLLDLDKKKAAKEIVSTNHNLLKETIHKYSTLETDKQQEIANLENQKNRVSQAQAASESAFNIACNNLENSKKDLLLAEKDYERFVTSKMHTPEAFLSSVKIESLEDKKLAADKATSDKDVAAKKIQTYKDEIAEAKRIATINDERITYNNSIEIMVNDNKKAVEKYLADVESIKASIDKYKKLLTLIEVDLPNYLIIKYSSQLEDHINAFMANIKEKIKVKLSIKNSGIDFHYTTNPESEKWLPAKMASGFESELLTLAFKIIIARMYDINILFLDEVDAAATMENSLKIYETVSTLVEFDQLFIITHEDEVRETLVNNYEKNISMYQVENGVFYVV